jgi:putative phosphoesterase
VLAGLERLAPVAAVAGNMDEPELRALLPERRIVTVGGARIGLVHDAGARPGREARLAGAFPSSSAIVYGHTHQAQVERYEDVWILNPGSPTERRRSPCRTMLLLEVEEGLVHPRLLALP